MSILTILYISFWFTVGCVATQAVLELARTLLLIGLTKLENHIKKKNGMTHIEEDAEQWLVDNAHVFDDLDDPMYNLMKDVAKRTH